MKIEYVLKIVIRSKNLEIYEYKTNQLEKLEAARSAYLWLPFLALLSLSRPY